MDLLLLMTLISKTKALEARFFIGKQEKNILSFLFLKYHFFYQDNFLAHLLCHVTHMIHPLRSVLILVSNLQIYDSLLY